MQSTKLNKGVLLGYGSIGRYHARILHERYPQIAIIDTAHDVRRTAAHDYPSSVVASNINELYQSGWDWHGSMGVIATWGPNHERSFLDLSSLGTQHILCEKPFAHSVRAGAHMVSTAEKHGISLGVHHHLRYSNFVNGLHRVTSDLGLGDPYSIIVHGGALGIVTNGIHYFDLACEIFGEGPQSVVSTATGDAINPRSKELTFYGGTACWSFPGGYELVMSFSNQSSVAMSASIYYRNAVAHVGSNFDVEVRRRDEAKVEQFPAVTRTGPADEIVFCGPIPGYLPAEARTNLMLDEIESGEVMTFPPSLALQALSGCIGALASGRERQSVVFPIDPMHDFGMAEWAIS